MTRTRHDVWNDATATATAPEPDEQRLAARTLVALHGYPEAGTPERALLVDLLEALGVKPYEDGKALALAQEQERRLDRRRAREREYRRERRRERT